MSLNPITVLYKEVNGSKISTDIYLPATASSEKKQYPVSEFTLALHPTELQIPTITVINIHGGAFMLGHSRMVSMPQITDCLERGWIVLVPNHRLCPGVDLLEGPMQDIRDLLAWVYDGHLDAVLQEQGPYSADLDNVAAFGTSSGGHLAMSLVCHFFYAQVAQLCFGQNN